MRAAQRLILIAFCFLIILGVLKNPPRAEMQTASTNPPLGGPLEGLSATELAFFTAGKQAFAQEFSIKDGLGPVFNARSCATCHGGQGRISRGVIVGGIDPTAQPTVGSFDPTTGQYIREPLLANFIDERRNFVVGAINADGSFNSLSSLGGGLIQKYSIRDMDPQLAEFPGGEVVPDEANLISMRETPPVFGDGLIDAIPDTEIVAQAVQKPDGIFGKVNWGTDQAGQPRAGRFGWKGQVATLLGFTAGALNGELGITSPNSQNETSPQGKYCPDVPGVAQPNDDGSRLFAMFQFQSLLAPPRQQSVTTAVQRGEQLFNSIGCTSCHTPEMKTARQVFLPQADGSKIFVSALSNRTARLFSDLLIHDMGVGLADGINSRAASGRHWRTTPLWGVSQRPYLLHDGRANNMEEAIYWHGGEAQIVRDRFYLLKDLDKSYLIAFLNSL